MENIKSGVYSIFCKDTGKYYIGSSKNIQRRITDHKNMLCNGKHHSIKLQNDYDKYGEKSFEYSVLVSCNYPEALKKEREFISIFHAEENGYNCTGNQLNNNMRLNEERYATLIMEYVKGTYISTGDVYCYELWSFIEHTFLTFRNFIKWLKPDTVKTIFVSNRIKDTDEYIMPNIIENELCITVVNRKKFNAENSEYILVDF